VGPKQTLEQYFVQRIERERENEKKSFRSASTHHVVHTTWPAERNLASTKPNGISRHARDDKKGKK